MGVHEFWRYDGRILRIYIVQDGNYQEAETSLTFPDIAKNLLYQFLQDCNEQGETVSKRQLRDRLNQSLILSAYPISSVSLWRSHYAPSLFLWRTHH